MATIDISRQTWTRPLVQALARVGWRAIAIPANGRLERNRQIVEFRTPNSRIVARFSIYAVGDRGETHRRDERRIEITTTYQSGLQRVPEYLDVVLGYDRQNDTYVGLDLDALNSVVHSTMLQVPSIRRLLRTFNPTPFSYGPMPFAF